MNAASPLLGGSYSGRPRAPVVARAFRARVIVGAKRKQRPIGAQVVEENVDDRAINVRTWLETMGMAITSNSESSIWRRLSSSYGNRCEPSRSRTRVSPSRAGSEAPMRSQLAFDKSSLLEMEDLSLGMMVP